MSRYSEVPEIPADARILSPIDDLGPIDEARGVLTAAGWDATDVVRLASIGLLPPGVLSALAAEIAQGEHTPDDVRVFVGSALRLGIRNGGIPRPEPSATLSRRVWDALAARMPDEQPDDDDATGPGESSE